MTRRTGYVVSVGNTGDPWKIEGVVAALPGLVDKGWSCSQIACELNREFGTKLTRNAVIGKLHRQGLSTKASAFVGPRPAPAPPPSKPPKQPPLAPPPAPEPERPRPSGRRIDLLGLTSRTCRWPLGDPSNPPGGFYCGDPTDIETRGEKAVYCAHHCAIAYQPVDPRRRRLTRYAA